VALLAAAAVALWLARGRRAPAARDGAAALDPSAAYEIGLKLGRAGRYTESLPYFRRAAEAPGGTTWQVRHDYSSTLHNATLESRMLGRFGQRISRSSVERVAMMHESLRQLDLAEADAGSRRDQAFLEAMRGNTLATWGFPLDALACYARALTLDPTMKAVPTGKK
jgi:tetratricopeptide (TPR) repeat protein